jgi:hypothetical protein
MQMTPQGTYAIMQKMLLAFILWQFLFLPDLLAGEIVTAKGLSFFESGREVIAREKALDEAKRAAIEKAMGTMIESRTIVENFQVVKDQIFTRSSGYLKDIKILKEKQTDLGTYEVEIQAEVEISVLVDDIDRLQNIIRWQQNPRIGIIIEPGLDNTYLPAAYKIMNLLTTKFKANGFKVFKHMADNDIQMGLLVGLSLEHATQKSKYKDLELTLNEVSLSANIYRPGDGEILATSSAVRSLPGENTLQVLDKGAKLCVNAIWKELRAKLIRLWEKELYSERDIYLIIKGLLSYNSAGQTADIFKSDVSGIVDARLIRFKKTIAEYDLKYRGWPDQLLNEIQMSYFKSKYFESNLENISGNKLVIQIK